MQQQRCDLSVETGEPFQSGLVHVRQATILLDGVSIFSMLVYDTEEDGSRSAEQARRNVTRAFGHRLSRLLEDE